MDDANLFQSRGYLIELAGKELRQGGFSLKHLPKLLKRILNERSWTEFETQLGQVVRHDSFDDFITEAPLAGLGSTLELVEKIVSVDPETRKLLRDARKRGKGGRPKKSVTQEGQVETPLYYNGVSRGTDSAYGLTVLEQNEPELYAEVISGNTSTHAALVKAGRRKPIVSVRLDDMASAARTLRKKLTADQRTHLARLLTDDEAI